MDAWQAIAAIAGVIGALAAIIRWLLSEYFKKANELEETKTSYQRGIIAELKETVEEHKKELKSIGIKLTSATVSLQQTDREIKNLTDNLSSYIDESHVRIQKLESHILKLSDDLIMVKGSHGKKTN